MGGNKKYNGAEQMTPDSKNPTFETVTLTNETKVSIRTSADFGVIDSTKVYFLESIIDMTGVSLEIPAGGIYLDGYNFDISGLVCADNNYTLFTSPVGGSGNVLYKDLHIEVNGTSSQVYDIKSLTGFEAIEIQRVNFNNITSLGTIDNYRQGLEIGTGRFGGTPELTLKGEWVGGYFIDTSIVRSLDNGAYSLFKAGTGFTMASRFRTNQNIDLPALASFFDFAPANFLNPSILQLDGCIMTRDGVFNAEDSNYTPNISETDLASSWNDNNGLPNTFVGGKALVSVEVTTTINTQSIFETLAGTFTESQLTHFDSPLEGQLRHLGSSPREFTVIGSFALDSQQNNVVTLKLVHWDDSASAFLDVESTPRQVNNFVGGRDVAFFNMNINIKLDKDDYIFWEVANESGTQSITAELDSYFIVNPR